MSHESSRDLLPWSSEPPSYGPPVDAEIKEERIRMLQREFGAKFKKGIGMGGGEDGEAPSVGSVDEKGKLITQGPRKRVAVRVLQGLFALASGASSIYGALVSLWIRPNGSWQYSDLLLQIIKPKSAPPPAGKLPAYVLYILSVITLLAILYLFVFRPCCIGRRSSSSNLTGGAGGMPGMPGMMVLPVQGGGMGGKGKKWKGGKKGKKGMTGPGGDVQVNLIVDPGMLQGAQGDPHHNQYGQDEYDDHLSMAGSYSPYGHGPSPTQQRRPPRPRRSIFAGLAMEEQWRVARAMLKKMLVFDIIGLALWAIEFVLILIGKRCPSGGFEGW